eukprot:NODE_434_length_8679_cov_0.241142.p8 type:complete len:138 gc:universal NODE_434_length_8679_cov_0.241142:7467-7054(-)
MPFSKLFRKTDKEKIDKPLDSKPPSIAASVSSSIPPASGIKFDLKRIFSVIEYNGLQFIILDCPTESTLSAILAEFKKYKVSDVVRVCEPTYTTKSLLSEGINVLDVPYIDGGTPPQAVVLKFLVVFANLGLSFRSF